jgi:hypothetical protein
VAGHCSAIYHHPAPVHRFLPALSGRNRGHRSHRGVGHTPADLGFHPPDAQHHRMVMDTLRRVTQVTRAGAGSRDAVEYSTPVVTCCVPGNDETAGELGVVDCLAKRVDRTTLLSALTTRRGSGTIVGELGLTASAPTNP